MQYEIFTLFSEGNDTYLSSKQSLYTLFKEKLSMSSFQLMLVLKFYVKLMTEVHKCPSSYSSFYYLLITTTPKISQFNIRYIITSQHSQF